MTTCSVVIRTLNEEAHLGRLLTGLEQQVTAPEEVIVVDSGSTDATLSIASAFGARIIQIDREQFSFGRALNIGFAAASADVGVALSGHVYPLGKTHLTHLLRPFDDDQVAVTFGRQVGSEDSYFSEKRLMLQWFPATGSGVQSIPFSNNANSATRLDVWKQLKFDEQLTGLEDVEFSHRATALGWQIYYVAEAPVVHIHHEPWDRIRHRYRREARTLVQLDPTQKLTLAHAIALSGLNAASDSLHAFRERSIAQDFPQIIKFRSAQFLGAWQGSRLDGKLTPEMRRKLFFPATPSGPFVGIDTGELIDYTGHRDHESLD